MQEAVVNAREERHAADLQRRHVPIDRHWFEYNALLTIFFDASSVPIPEAERVVVRTVEAVLPYIHDEDLRERARILAHEEMAHSKVHDAYNAYLNRIGMKIDRQLRMGEQVAHYLERHLSLKSRVALCAMIEHCTSIMSRHFLASGILEGKGVDERMDRLWTWHALEELHHRSTMFDLYTYLGGTYGRRIRICLLATTVFFITHLSCFFYLVRREGVLFNAHVWRRGWAPLFGKDGVYGHFVRDWLLFLRPHFHPDQLLLENTLKKQLHHYPIESELASYFA